MTVAPEPMVASRSRHLVDPELLALIDRLPQVRLSADNLAAVRAAQQPPVPVDAATAGRTVLERRAVPGPAGAPAVPIAVYRPADRKDRRGCILHLHGGGFVAGASRLYEGIHRGLVDALGCVLVSVDYRLAPESRYPAAIEDCYAALAWLFGAASELGVGPARIGVMGESAGGGLAAALALLARDRGEFGLAFQHLIYPMLDDRTGKAGPPHPYAGEYLWTPHNNAFAWDAMLGPDRREGDVPAYAAPARADRLDGLPPTYVAAGALDLLADEDIDYARRLLRAGVPTELHVYPGAFHGFERLGDGPLSRRARADSLAALRRHAG